jgi:MFS family permease
VAGLREPWFARFTLARVLLVAVELALPYFTLAARHSGAAATVGFLLVASGLAELVGGPTWGKLTDRVSPQASFLAAAGIALLAVALGAATHAAGAQSIAPYAVALFLAALARGGVRTGRKAYLINTAPAAFRSLYTATSNSLGGIAMLSFAAVGALAGAAGETAALYVVAGCAVSGGLLAATLPTSVTTSSMGT